MPLESATYISDLNTSNPVGSTDKVQTLDDHVRLIKSTLKTTFPNVTGAVTATHTELNLLDGVTATTAELNILDGVTLTAANINDAALKSAANTFTRSADAASTQLFDNTSTGTSASSQARYRDSAGAYLGLFKAGSGYTGTLLTSGPSGDQVAIWASANVPLVLGQNNTQRMRITDSASTTTIHGVAISDLARLSQANTFTGASLTVSNNGNPFVIVTDADNSVSAYMQAIGTGTVRIGANTNHTLALVVNSTEYMTINTSGNFDFKSGTAAFGSTVSIAGAVTAATIANSTSETLVAGQLHFIDGAATLPNLTAGQWIEVINDSASPITISKNGSDTTYWALTGATVATSFTLAARGRLSAVCNPAGSAVYVAGSGITAAT